MYYVYILLSKKDGQLYIGSTPNLSQRLIRHERGFVISTKNRRPLKLIYYECYLSETDARKREIYLKGGNGRAELKVQLQKTFDSIDYKYRYST